ncbi:MAG: D-glycero-beta-D-manno-heptose 1-phosphate adenylyltransferase [Bacteroidota bacterium]
MKVFINKIQAKILNWQSAAEEVQAWKAAGQRVVFTNGCFDLLHYGHIHYLSQAKDLGDRLIIGINSDQSVSRLKGAHRPIKDEKTRMCLLAALVFVDAVVLFEEDTPLDLIRQLIPHVLVKGGDWKPEQIVGSDFVIKNGGSVKSLPFIEGYSTTNYEKKIKGEN